jgi:hypothetical protein
MCVLFIITHGDGNGGREVAVIFRFRGAPRELSFPGQKAIYDKKRKGNILNLQLLLFLLCLIYILFFAELHTKEKLASSIISSSTSKFAKWK